MRRFEVAEGFKNEPVVLPQRGTKKAAGYDFRSLEGGVVQPGETVMFKTGVTVLMEDDEVLYLVPRSGLAKDYNITLMNTPGVIDADYYPNAIGALIHNAGSEPFVVNPGDRVCQGVFGKFLITDDDMPKDVEREAGWGHTGTK